MSQDAETNANLDCWKQFLKSLKAESPIARKDDAIDRPDTCTCLSDDFAQKLEAHDASTDGLRPGSATHVTGNSERKPKLRPLNSVACDTPSLDILKFVNGDDVSSSDNGSGDTVGMEMNPIDVTATDDIIEEAERKTPLKKELQLLKFEGLPYSQDKIKERPLSVVKRGKPSTLFYCDRSNHVSKWTLKMLSKYFIFKTCVKDLELAYQPSDAGAELSSLVKEHYDTLLKFQEVSLKDIASCLVKESDARIFIDRFLLEVCTAHNLRLQTERDFKSTRLPNGTFDYLISTENRIPVGCVEAKTPFSLDKKAFVQSVLQVCAIQQLAWKYRVDVEAVPVFCILTDSFRFVFIQLQGRELRLEHQPPTASNAGEQVPLLRVRSLVAEDFECVVNAISSLISLVVK
ncbi:uncharacterized protein [Haliotis cracherodii]|uniref:uncharacterized protein n=1 Tax=Haliotis cracherodii TaxID=6455 RepID=UPI0039E77179